MSDAKLGGTATAVIVGFIAILYAIFSKETFGTKVIVFLLGAIFAWLGITNSKT